MWDLGVGVYSNFLALFDRTVLRIILACKRIARRFFPVINLNRERARMDFHEEEYIEGFDVREFPDFADYDEEDIRGFIEEWFGIHFEDPNNEMPPAEGGGYEYPYGGPYDAYSAISTVFDLFIDDHELLQKIASEIEQKDGIVDWAPTNSHPAQLAIAAEHREMADWYEYEYENWLKSADPRAQLKNANTELISFVSAQTKNGNFDLFLRRMAFVQAWSNLEAYLYSKLIKSIREMPSALKRLCSEHTEFSKKKFLAREILENPDAILIYVTDALHKTSYHDLSKTAGLYQNAFGKLPIEIETGIKKASISIDQPMGILEPLVLKRHDCVHRNGKTIEDKAVEISSDDIMAVVNEGTKLSNKLDELVEYHKYCETMLDAVASPSLDEDDKTGFE